MMTWWQAHQKTATYNRDFRERGLENVRQQIKHSTFAPEKHKAAERWVNQEDHKHQRWALFLSAIAIAISASALAVTGWAAMNASKADRAWVGPATMRLSHRPAAGQELRFYLEYQNTGRQPAQDVFVEMDSYRYNRQMTGDIAERSKRYLARCKSSNPSGDRLTIFPGKGTFEAYRVGEQFVTSEVINGSDVILIDGCMVYRTLNEIHRTAFCFQYDVQNARDDEDGKPVMNLCNHGHYAD
jgi:hypothetical protein